MNYLKKFKKILKSLLLHIFATGRLSVSTQQNQQPIKAFMLFGAIFPFSKFRIRNKEKVSKDRRVFFLKVNSISKHAILCIQHWLEVVFLADADFYIVCDNPLLKKQILNQCRFRDQDIKFLKSMRSQLKGVAKNLYTGNWGNAAYAHLTPFYYSESIGIERHWDIDADDMIFLIDEKKILDALNEAEAQAKQAGLSGISLDVHNSRSNGIHWSLGIMYVDDNDRFCRTFESVDNLVWTDRFKDYAIEFNLDWFLTHAKDKGILPLSSFYVNQAYFIHWGDFFLLPIGCGIYHWQNNQLIDGVLHDVFGFQSIGIKQMVDSHRVDIDLDGTEGPEYWLHHVWRMDDLQPTYKNLWSLSKH